MDCSEFPFKLPHARGQHRGCLGRLDKTVSLPAKPRHLLTDAGSRKSVLLEALLVLGFYGRQIGVEK